MILYQVLGLGGLWRPLSAFPQKGCSLITVTLFASEVDQKVGRGLLGVTGESRS